MIISLTCPKCGGKLEVTPELDRFACGHCGTEHLVQRQGGTVSLAPVVQQLERIGGSSDRTAAELALPRLQGEEAWLEAQLERHLASRKSAASWTPERYILWAASCLLGGFLLIGMDWLLISDIGLDIVTCGLLLATVVCFSLVPFFVVQSRRKYQPKTYSAEMQATEELLAAKRQEIANCRNTLSY